MLINVRRLRGFTVRVMDASRLSSTASCSIRCMLDDGVSRFHHRHFQGRIGLSGRSARIMQGQEQRLTSGPRLFGRHPAQRNHRRLHCLNALSHRGLGDSVGSFRRPQTDQRAERDVSARVRPIPALDSDLAHTSPDRFAQLKEGSLPCSLLPSVEEPAQPRCCLPAG